MKTPAMCPTVASRMLRRLELGVGLSPPLLGSLLVLAPLMSSCSGDDTGDSAPHKTAENGGAPPLGSAGATANAPDAAGGGSLNSSKGTASGALGGTQGAAGGSDVEALGCALDPGSVLRATMEDSKLGADVKNRLCVCLAPLMDGPWGAELAKLFATSEPDQNTKVLENLDGCCSNEGLKGASLTSAPSAREWNALLNGSPGDLCNPAS